jgi:mono/diheme cytochrome c family protein
MRDAWYWIACGGAGCLMWSFAGTSVAGQTIKNETAPRVTSIEGVDTYKAYCATCHGPQGKGDGPAAAALKKAPADLTTIAKRHDGKFSPTDVEAVILGKQVLLSHGSRDMPIWGPVFEAYAPDPMFMKLRVTNLVNYIQSIQVQ